MGSHKGYHLARMYRTETTANKYAKWLKPKGFIVKVVKGKLPKSKTTVYRVWVKEKWN